MNRFSPNDPQILLIFYNSKGIGQVVRLLLCYLQVPFADIYIQQYQTQRQTLPHKIRQIVESHQINKADLPAIIHDGEVIYQLNQIMTYICRIYERQDLLGVDLQQKTQVCQILEIYFQRLMPNIMFLTNFSINALNSSLEGIQFLQLVQATYLQYLKSSGYVMELALYLLKQENPKFVYGNITIVDFFYKEGSKIVLSMFGAIDYLSASPKWTQLAQKYLAYKQQKGEGIQKLQILRTIKKYQTFIKSQQFYKKKQEYIEHFKVFPKNMPENALMGLRKVWATDEKQLPS